MGFAVAGLEKLHKAGVGVRVGRQVVGQQGSVHFGKFGQAVVVFPGITDAQFGIFPIPGSFDFGAGLGLLELVVLACSSKSSSLPNRR